MLADSAAVAVLIGRSASYVRRLARAGVIPPAGVGRRRGSGGRPPVLYDLLEVQERLADTPYWRS